MRVNRVFQIPLGILPQNEFKKEEMIAILQHLHHYVPASGENLLQIGFAGDQLTAARAIDSRVNSQDPFEALVPFACDWHAKVSFLSVSVNTWHMYILTHLHTHLHICSPTLMVLIAFRGKGSTRPAPAQKVILLFCS